MATSEQKIQTAAPDPDEAAIYRETKKRRLWQIIGATKFANRLATSLSAQGVHGAELIRDDTLWEAEGYESFRDFLDHHPESPMSYHQFDQRSKLLRSEGDLLFDLLSSLDVPMKARTLLTGQIEVDGNELRVGDTRVRRDDEAGILNLITTQYAKLQENERTIERGKKDIEKHKRLVVDAEKRAAANGIDSSPLVRSMMLLATAFREVEDALEAADGDEKQASQDGLFDLMRNGQLRCSAKLGLASSDEVRQQRPNGARGDDADEGLED